jgi:DhnA family fructose-bisphosphate aldolase class Ia
MDGKALRLSRLFPDNGKGNAVIVAIDHGQTFGPADGLVQYTQAAEKLKGANGVLLTPFMIRHSGNLFLGPNSPVVLSRLNWNTIHCEPWHYKQAHIVKAISVGTCIAQGAEVVLASLVLQNETEDQDARNVSNFAALVEEADVLGIPMVGEVFPRGDLRNHPDEFHDYIKKACRIICELGADAIKTFYTGDRFAEVTEGVPIPVFALGAEKMEREVDALELAQRAIQRGARGVVFGRNVIQAVCPEQFLAGLKDVVQNQVSPAEAAQKFNLR